MNCTICHDVHTTEHSAASYSLKCLACHQWQSCGMSKQMDHNKLVNGCVDCHMPIEETNVIASDTAGQVVHAKMRNHWIRIYPGVHLPETTATATHH
jgi:hypothetical protein